MGQLPKLHLLLLLLLLLGRDELNTVGT